VARLATADAGGQPHLVPIVFAVVEDEIYSATDNKPKSTAGSQGRLRRLDNIRANASVSVLVDHYEDDWSRLWWARADGTARVVAATDADAAGPLGALIERYPQYQVSPPPGPLVATTVQRWSGWAASVT